MIVILHKKILEIGSWHGRSTRVLAENTTGVVYAVDMWNGYFQPQFYKSAQQNNGDHAFLEFLKNNGDLIDKGKIIPIRIHSGTANWVFKQLGIKFDMIFIDGDHEYEGIRSDIIGAKSLLADGALLCGHDYLYLVGVQRAVNELVPGYAVEQKTSIWYRKL